MGTAANIPPTIKDDFLDIDLVSIQVIVSTLDGLEVLAYVGGREDCIESVKFRLTSEACAPLPSQQTLLAEGTELENHTKLGDVTGPLACQLCLTAVYADSRLQRIEVVTRVDLDMAVDTLRFVHSDDEVDV